MKIQCFDIAVLIDPRKTSVGHAELLALIDVGCSLHQVQHGGQGLGRGDAKVTLVAIARYRPRQIVVAPE